MEVGLGVVLTVMVVVVVVGMIVVSGLPEGHLRALATIVPIDDYFVIRRVTDRQFLTGYQTKSKFDPDIKNAWKFLTQESAEQTARARGFTEILLLLPAPKPTEEAK